MTETQKETVRRIVVGYIDCKDCRRLGCFEECQKSTERCSVFISGWLERNIPDLNPAKGK